MEPLVNVLVVEDTGDAVEVEREVGGDEVADLCGGHEGGVSGGRWGEEDERRGEKG